MVSSWNKIYFGFDPEDETINFGTRRIAVNADSNYEATTVATIQSETQVTANPQLFASIHESQLCISIDRSIIIFKDKSCKNVRLCIDFDSLITSHLIIDHGRFLLVSLDIGTLYCLNLEMGGRLIFSRDIPTKCESSHENIIRIFLRDDNQSSCIMLVTSMGQIFKLSGFSEKIMHAVHNEEDEMQLQELTEDVDCSLVYKCPTLRKIHSADLCISHGDQSIALVGEDVLIWPAEKHCSLKDQAYIKIEYLKNNRLTLCLQSDGALSVLCPDTLLRRKVWNGPALDIVVVEDEANTPPQLLALMFPEAGSSDTFIKLIAFPDFQVKYTLKASASSFLVNFDTYPTGEMVYLEGSKKASAFVDTVTVKLIIEKLPDAQLERLVRRGKYAEAEIFAKRFRLGRESIYSAKAAALTKELNARMSEDDVTPTEAELLQTLDKITNVKIIFEYCCNTVIQDYERSRNILSYARERLAKYGEKTNDIDVPAYLSELNSKLTRVETFDMMEKIKSAVLSDDENDNTQWSRFSRADLLSECRNYLMAGNLEVAALIWVRHVSVFAKQITTEVVRDLLDIIPATTSQRELWPWLFHFVPSVLSIFPEGLAEIVTWGYKKTKLLERVETHNWPQCGIDFSRGLVDLLNFEESQSFFHLQKQYEARHSPLLRLINVMQALSDLKFLRVNFRLNIQIDTYMQEPMEVTHSLLDEIESVEVENFINNFLTQFMLNHSLEYDHVLSVYIYKILKNSEDWWFWNEAPWEEKISNIIRCIQNVEIQLQQTLAALKRAPVPWSPTMLGLVEASLSLSHPLVASILTERDFVTTKLILKKYGYHHVGMNQTLFKYIIKQNHPEMMDDLYELLKSNSSFKTTALVFCVNYFLNKGDIEKMTTVINCMNDDNALYCCKQVVNYTAVCLKFEETNQSAEFYAEVLGAVQYKLHNMLSTNNNPNAIFDDTLIIAEELKSLCLLRKEFGIHLTLNEYQSKSETVLRTIIDKLCKDFTIEKAVRALYKSSMRIADLLGISRVLTICILLETTSSIRILQHYVEHVGKYGHLPSAECCYAKRLCETSVIILKREQMSELKNLKQICAVALDNCPNEQLPRILLTAIWINLGSHVVDDGITVSDRSGTSNWKLYNIYADTAICSSQIVNPFFENCFKFYLSYSGNRQHHDTEIATDKMKELVHSWEKIDPHNFNLSMLQILNNLISSYSTVFGDDKLRLSFKSVLKDCLRMILKKVISARSFDLQLGLSCLCALEENDASQWLVLSFKAYATDYSRHSTICDLGYEYSRLIKNVTRSSYFAYYRVCHDWARRLSDYGVYQKELLSSNTENKQEILERLMSSKKSGILVLFKNFCADFEFDLDECYILYLEILLKQWTPTMTIGRNLNGQQELTIDHGEVIAIGKTCKEITSYIDNKPVLEKHINRIWSQINFYHYEIFELLMKLTEDRDDRRISHLHFLKSYTRIGPPTQVEIEEWSRRGPENNTLPKIAKWRIPFLPEIDQWKLIRHELDLSTYERWLEVAGVLNLQVHNICSLTIKGAVTRVWESTNGANKKKTEWLIYPKQPTLLAEIEKCVGHMSHSDALKYGTAALCYVVSHTPPGADQTAAARVWYTYAQKLSRESDDADEEIIEKIKFTHLQLTATHILYTHGLGVDRYLRLIPHPEKLARELYMDESIVARSRGATDHRPDINSAVNALEEIFSLNIMQLRAELLEEWLRPSNTGGKLDETMTCNFVTHPSTIEYNPTDDENLLRACYILELGKKRTFANFLINIAFGTSLDSGYGPETQFRALHVLLSITDSVTVQELTKRDVRSIKRYMKSLSFISDLDSLGFQFSVKTFENCSKLELVQELCKRHLYVPRIAKLILNLCTHYKLTDYAIWDKALSAMAKMLMVQELAKFLPKLSASSHAVGCNGSIKGWDVLIFEPFRKANIPLSRNQFDDCVKSISRLHSCPVAHELNLPEVVETCFHCKHPELAAALLPFLKTDYQKLVVEKIRNGNNFEKVIDDLRSLSSRGILTTSYSIRLLKDCDTPNGSGHLVNSTLNRLFL